jgi:hypothetical protein
MPFIKGNGECQITLPAVLAGCAVRGMEAVVCCLLPARNAAAASATACGVWKQGVKVRTCANGAIQVQVSSFCACRPSSLCMYACCLCSSSVTVM